MADGVSLRAACEQTPGANRTTVISWAVTDVNGFSAQYARAQVAQAHAFADKLADLAAMEPRMITQTVSEKGGKTITETKIDPSFETWRKTEIAAIQWILARILFRVYGDKLQVEHNHTVNPAMVPDGELAQIALSGKVIDGTCSPVVDAPLLIAE